MDDKQADVAFRTPRVTVGRIVQIDHYKTPINGTRSSPAIVTNVWDPHKELPMINVTMFGDAQAPSFRGSVYHANDERAGENPQYVWRWPDRV